MVKQLSFLLFKLTLVASVPAANTSPSVVVITTYEPVEENSPFEVTPVPDFFMAQLKHRDVAFMEALIIDDLIAEDGCLRIEGEAESHLIIWQADYSLHDNNGRLEILDEMGKVVAQVGEKVYLGGGEQRTVDNGELLEPLPAQCSGPYFDFLYNLNRQMTETPMAEVENILPRYDGHVEVIEPAAPLSSRPDVVSGTYRFTIDEDSMALLVDCGRLLKPF